MKKINPPPPFHWSRSASLQCQFIQELLGGCTLII
jgi:hypothetical protein